MPLPIVGFNPSASEVTTDTNGYFVRLTIGDYVRPKPFDPAKMIPQKYIFLPLPRELRDETGVSYTNVDLNTIGDLMNNNFDGNGISSTIAAGLLRNSGDIITGAGNLVGKGIDSVISKSQAGAIISKLSGAVVDRAFPADKVTSAISQGLGVSANPNPSVTFSGPKLRDLNFSWTLMPTNLKESNDIRKIINYLKASTLPTNTIKGSASILNYPKMVRINFFPWDSGGTGKYGWTERSIIRSKHCFISSFNVNYTSGTVPAFFEGGNHEPVVIEVSMSLVETEYFLSHDWQGDGTDQDGGMDINQFVNNIASDVSSKVSSAFDGIGDLLSKGGASE